MDDPLVRDGLVILVAVLSALGAYLVHRFAPPALRGGACGALDPASARPRFAVIVGGRSLNIALATIGFGACRARTVDSGRGSRCDVVTFMLMSGNRA